MMSNKFLDSCDETTVGRSPDSILIEEGVARLGRVYSV